MTETAILVVALWDMNDDWRKGQWFGKCGYDGSVTDMGMVVEERGK